MVKKMKLVCILLPEEWVKALDFLVRWDESYPNRSVAIRMAIRNLLNEELREGVGE